MMADIRCENSAFAANTKHTHITQDMYLFSVFTECKLKMWHKHKSEYYIKTIIFLNSPEKLPFQGEPPPPPQFLCGIIHLLFLPTFSTTSGTGDKSGRQRHDVKATQHSQINFW
jgi:hypothetical protein